MQAYLTAAEFQNHPTGLNVANLIPNGSPAQNTAELTLLTQLASSYLEQHTYSAYYARTITNETDTFYPTAAGQLEVRLEYFPIISVTSAQWSQQSNYWQSIDLNQTTLFPTFEKGHKFLAYDYPYSVFVGWGQPALSVQTTYVAGYPNMALTGAVTAGEATATVDTVLGVNPGDTVTFFDGVSQETAIVETADTTTNVLTFTASLQFNHAIGVRVSELPYALTLAAIYATSWLIKGRRAGASALMRGQIQPQDIGESEDLQMFRELIKPFKRVI